MWGTSGYHQICIATEVPVWPPSFPAKFSGFNASLLSLTVLLWFPCIISSDSVQHVLIFPLHQQYPSTCLPEIFDFDQRWFAHTAMEEGSVPAPSEPPPLPYSLHTRKKSIAIFWFIFVVDTLAQPLILYWCLWYLTDLSHNLGMFGKWTNIGPHRWHLAQYFQLSPLRLEVSQFSNTSTASTIYCENTHALDPLTPVHHG